MVDSKVYDLSNRFTVLYNHKLGFSSVRIRRRVLPYAIDQACCPYNYHLSRLPTPRTQSLTRQAGPRLAFADSQILSWGECDESEFRIEGRHDRTRSPSQNLYRLICSVPRYLGLLADVGHRIHVGGQDRWTGTSRVQPGARYSVEASLTNPDSRTLMKSTWYCSTSRNTQWARRLKPSGC